MLPQAIPETRIHQSLSRTTDTDHPGIGPFHPAIPATRCNPNHHLSPSNADMSHTSVDYYSAVLPSLHSRCSAYRTTLSSARVDTKHPPPLPPQVPRLLFPR